MKRFKLTPTGTLLWSRNARAALLVLGLLAAVFTLAAPTPAQDNFPWATRVKLTGPTVADLVTNIPIIDYDGKTLGYKILDIRTFPDCPQWVKDLYNEPDDPLNLEDGGGRYVNMLQFLDMTQRDPVFTPDGKSIVFDDRIFGAWMVPVGGGEPKLACDWYMSFIRDWNSPTKDIIGGIEGIWQTCGISPDGKEVVGVKKLVRAGAVMDTLGYSVTSNGQTTPLMKLLFHDTAIVSRNIATGEERFISKDAIQGHWSHDGRWFVYVKRDPNLWYSPSGNNLYAWEQMITGVYVRNMSTGQEWMIAPAATCPCFSPDNSSVICSMKAANGIWQIYSIPREGGSPKQLTFYGLNDPGCNARVSDVSPDGRWILHTGAFTKGDITKFGLFVFNTVSGKSYPLFPDATCFTTDGSFSPDGRKIVFSASYPYTRVIPYNASDYGVTYPDRAFGIYITDFNPDTFQKPTAVTEAVPEGFEITGNYPNPFNPTTTIRFTLPESGNAILAVYNVSGQKVRELATGTMNAGAHSLVWDSRDESGKPVSSGVYISRLTWNGKTAVNRMLLAK